MFRLVKKYSMSILLKWILTRVWQGEQEKEENTE